MIAVKKFHSTLLITLCVIAMQSQAHCANFPILAEMGGAFRMSPDSLFYINSAKNCGFNMVHIGWMPESWTKKALDTAKAHGMKSIIEMATIGESRPATRHNLL